MIIVLMLSNLFQQSTRSWGIGLHEAKIGLEARAAINIIQHDLGQAVASTNAGQLFTATGTELSFAMFSRTNGVIEQVTYSFPPPGGSGDVERNGVKLVGGESIDSCSVSVPGVGDVTDITYLPDLVQIDLTMSAINKFSEVRVYAHERNHDYPGINPTDVIDTDRGN